MSIEESNISDFSKDGKWGISKNYFEHKPNDIYDSLIKQTKYRVYKKKDNQTFEEYFNFYYEENYNKYADIQQYIGIRNFEWKEDSKLYLESAEGDSDTVDLNNDDIEDIKKRIDILNGERKIY